MEKIMKWKLLLLIPFCLSLLMPLTTNAGEPAFRPPTTGGYNPHFVKNPISPTGNVGSGLNPANDPIYDNSKTPVSSNAAKKISKTQKVVRIGVGLKTANHIRKNKWKYLAGAVVVGGSVGYIARNNYQDSIDRVVDKYVVSDLWSSEKKDKLIPILRKKIEKSKPEDQPVIIEAVQQSLIYYMVFYNDESWGKLANSVLNSLNIMNNDVVMQVNSELSKRKEAYALILSAVDKIERNRKKTNCQKGSYERNYIISPQVYSPTVRVLNEWDVDNYGMQVNINEKYKEDYPIQNRYRVSAHQLSRYDFEKDHIPSKLAVAKYLEKRDNHGIKYAKPISGYIIRNAISVVLKTSVHKSGRTNGYDNQALSTIDARDLKKAVFKDFISYYVLAYQGGYDDQLYKANWLKAFVETYIRNEALCLFI